MKVKAQDLKPGHRCTTPFGLVTIMSVDLFGEKRSAIVPVGVQQTYIPGCVFVTYRNEQKGEDGHHTFQIDEEVDRAFILE